MRVRRKKQRYYALRGKAHREENAEETASLQSPEKKEVEGAFQINKNILQSKKPHYCLRKKRDILV